MQFLKCTVAVLLAAPIFGSGGNEAGLTVHEWGTFTTVADEAGGQASWSPLGGPSDLPCFVVHLGGMQYKMLSPAPAAPPTQTVTVRMETPVLYFYAPHKTDVSVAVDFPKGLITEWYPQATSVTPHAVPSSEWPTHNVLPTVAQGHIVWNSVTVRPGEEPALPRGNGASHYYAARNTDANAVSVNKQDEKLLFYRGIANFTGPMSARVTGRGSVEVRNTGDRPLALAVLFENRDGQIGYRIVRGLTGSSDIPAPALNGNLDGLKQDLAAALVSQGLYRKEAEAMIETWRDSWFEEGMRMFYLVPRTVVDRELPLTVKPAPANTSRVFVGRVELLSPYLRDRLSTALAAGNTQALERFGRFLAPFVAQVKVTAAPSLAAYFNAKAEAAQREFYNPSCVR